MKRILSVTKKIINHIGKSVAKPVKHLFAREEEQHFFKEASSKFSDEKFKHSAKNSIRHVLSFATKNKMYLATVLVFFTVIAVLGNKLTGMSVAESNFEICDADYSELASESSSRISNLEVDLTKCNSELTSSKSEFSRVTNSMSNLTDEFVSCYSNIQSLGSINSECSNNLAACRNEIISMEETVKDSLEQEASAKDALGTTQEDYAKVVENYSKFKCCILKINDFTIGYHYISDNQVVCTSASNENTIPLSC